MSDERRIRGRQGIAVVRPSLLAIMLVGACHSQSIWDGHWRGPVNQPGSIPYSIDMTLGRAIQGKPVGTVSYPELNCAGSLLAEAVTARSITLRESILENRNGNCTDGVKIVLTISGPDSPTASLVDYRPDGKPGGTAELRREMPR